MKKRAIALLATAALGMPAMAASNMTQHPQGQQAQQSQDRQSQVQYKNNNQQAQYPNNQQARPNNTNQAAQNKPNNNQTISPQSLPRSEIRQVQQALDKNGVQVGRVDGRWGSRTSDALKQFQQSKNIQANGQLDPQTLSALGLNSAQFSQNQNNASRTQ